MNEGELTANIGPEFKFGGAELALAGVGATIKLHDAVPVITAEGIGESTARWLFTAHPSHPLVGSRTVFAIVELPPGVPAARASIQLMAKGKRGLLGLFTEEQRESLSWVLE